MIPLGMIERRQGTGWKIMDRDKETGILTTPYQDMQMGIGKTYFAEGIEKYGIYIFLNKLMAKKFLEHIPEIGGRDTLLVKVEIGNNIWKGKVDSGFSTFANQNYHFYTTDSIKILSIEE